jgi:4-hydroxysphinganine ceramide fatty acyl 2-hydroxylase
MASHDIRFHRIRLFRSERLEMLTMVSPRTFCLIWGLVLPVAVWAGWGTAGWVMGAGLFFGGLLFWSLFEYIMHRFLFHCELDWRAVRWFVFLIHGNHHASPNDDMRNLMPPIVSLPMGALVWWGCVVVAGPAGTWLFLGFVQGYVCYDLVHFACHQWPLQGALGVALKRHHIRHHHVNGHGNYAVTAIFWDRVFRSRITSLKG